MPKLSNMLTCNAAGRSMPVTGMRTPRVGEGEGVAVGAWPHAAPALLVLSDLVEPSSGSTQMMATVLGSGPSTGVSKLIVVFAGTTSSPEAVPPTTHQTTVTEKSLELRSCQARVTPGLLVHGSMRAKPPLTGMKAVEVAVSVAVGVRVKVGVTVAVFEGVGVALGGKVGEGVLVAVGVLVRVLVGVLLGADVLLGVGVLVGVLLGVGVSMGVVVLVGVGVSLGVGVSGGVGVLVKVPVGVGVLVGVSVSVLDGVGVSLGVDVLAGVPVGVLVAVFEGVTVLVGVRVDVGVSVGVLLGVLVGVGVMAAHRASMCDTSWQTDPEPGPILATAPVLVLMPEI